MGSHRCACDQQCVISIYRCDLLMQSCGGPQGYWYKCDVVVRALSRVQCHVIIVFGPSMLSSYSRVLNVSTPFRRERDVVGGLMAGENAEKEGLSCNLNKVGAL